MRRIDEIFAQERALTGQSAGIRHSVRQQVLRPMVDDLHDWMRRERSGMSRRNPVGKAMAYMVGEKGRWDAFARFLDDGRTCVTNSAAELDLRGVALGRKACLFAGSPRGGNRAAFMYSRIVTAKMNDVDPQAWLADVLARLPNHAGIAVAGLAPVELDKPSQPESSLTTAYAGCLVAQSLHLVDRI